jgi:hypothetical protein
LNRVQQARIVPAARAEGFYGQGVAALAPQVLQEQGGQQSFADTGISAGNEYHRLARRGIHDARDPPGENGLSFARVRGRLAAGARNGASSNPLG